MSERHPELRGAQRRVTHVLMCVQIAGSRVIELSVGTVLYGPMRCKDETAFFLVQGERHRCHIDEFVEFTEVLKKTRAAKCAAANT